jgi:methylmalonyl-CoA/ethylmalonyl-CoA epimerase
VIKTGPIETKVKLHHLGIAVRSIATSAQQYHRALGIAVEGKIIEDEIQRVRVAFAPTGNGTFLEFVEPLTDDSPVCGVLKRGGGLYHVCYIVKDLSAAIDQVEQAGGRRISGPVPARAFAGRQIAWVYTPDRSLVEFLEH